MLYRHFFSGLDILKSLDARLILLFYKEIKVPRKYLMARE